MTVLLIPTSDDPNYSQVTDLDGVDYLFRFVYNSRQNCWYFDLSLVDETKLLSGIKVTTNNLLLSRFKDPRLPPGDLVAAATGADTSTAGMGELGVDRRVILTYFSVNPA